MAHVPEQIGQFKVTGLLGKGAMGEVYEGIDSVLGRRVALKVLGKKHQESAEFKNRFLREGRALAAMNHNHVVQIYFIGEHEDRPFLAMEFIDGDDVGVILKKGGAVHGGDAAEILKQAAQGLAETQRSGVVHRDVKPSNLVITADGVVKVTDFGLAKALQEDLSITATGVFVGTPDYLAPEQAMGEEVDASADIYALGCTLYHMCSGHPPFRKGGSEDHYTAVVRRHLKAERPQLKKEIEGFDEELSDLCRMMMSRRPDVRPDFETLVEKLESISSRLRGRVPPRHTSVELSSSAPVQGIPAPAPAAASPQSAGAEAASTPAVPERSSNLPLIVAGGVIGGVAIGLAIAAAWGML